MWSGFPCHVRTSAHDSAEKLLTFHVIYQEALHIKSGLHTKSGVCT